MSDPILLDHSRCPRPVASVAAMAVAVVLLCAPQHTTAQALYRDAGVSLEPIPGFQTTSGLMGFDAAGFAYMSGSGQSFVSCFHPDDPEATAASAASPEGTWSAAMAPDGAGVALFGLQPTEISTARFVCDDGVGGALWEDLGTFTPVGLPAQGLAGLISTVPMLVDPDGAHCFLTSEGMWCGATDAGAGIVEFSLRVDIATIADAVSIDPALGTPDPDLPAPPGSEWRLQGAAWHAGRLFLLASGRHTGSLSSDWLPHVLEQGSDGQISVLVGPQLPDPAPSDWLPGGQPHWLIDPLDQATHLLVEPTLDALIVWPTQGQELATHVENGWTGFGLLSIPLTESSRSGHIGLTTAAYRGEACPCTDAGSIPVAVSLPDGALAVGISTSPAGTTNLHRLVFDLDALDVDGDGLSAAEEQALETSDYTVHSDGGTTSDGIEVRLTGTDPTDGGDDPAPTADTRVAYAQSGMIDHLLDSLPLDIDHRWGAVPGGGPLAPLCLGFNAEISCFTAYDADAMAWPGGVISPDGRYTAVHSDEGFAHLFFEDGRREELGAWQDLAIFELPTDQDPAVQLFPVREDLLLVALSWAVETPKSYDDELLVIALAPDAAPALLYDHQQARCDSELGPCDPTGYANLPKTTWHDVLWASVRAVGWVAELGCLLIEVPTIRDRYYVGISPEEGPLVLVHGRGLMGGARNAGLPGIVQPSGHGDLLTDVGLLDGWLNPHPDAVLPQISASQPPAVFWGDVVMQKIYVARSNDVGQTFSSPRLYELVRYEGWGAPGDVLSLQRVSPWGAVGADYMLWRSGSRGGYVAAWPAALHMDDPWGIDASATGQLCVAERGAERVRIFSRSTDDDAYVEDGEGYEDVGEVVDCHYENDGTLYALLAEPPQIVRLVGRDAAPEIVQELSVTSTPIDLIRAPDGSFEVLEDDGDSRGFTYLSDGSRLEMLASDFLVLRDGAEVVRLNQLIYAVWGRGVSGTSETHVRFVERADGLVVATPFARNPIAPVRGIPWILDPDTGDAWMLSGWEIEPEAGSGLTIIPGGEGGDPWGRTGLPEPPVSGDVISTEDTTAPVEEVPRARKSNGCQRGTGGTSWHPLFVLLGVAASGLARRRMTPPPQGLGV